jgi:hypothetical protein
VHTLHVQASSRSLPKTWFLAQFHAIQLFREVEAAREHQPQPADSTVSGQSLRSPHRAAQACLASPLAACIATWMTPTSTPLQIPPRQML